MLRVSNIKIDIDDKIELVREKLLKKLKIKNSDILEYSIYKESVDARKKDKILLVYTVDILVKNEDKILKFKPKDTTHIDTNRYIDVKMGDKSLKHKPVVVGSGPAGLFASLILAQRGYKPLMFERGMDVDQRTRDIENFWSGGDFKPKSNVQFGEGGAGTFSDGKLTTRLKDIRSTRVLEEFVKHGAPEEILYSHKPHVGTDILKNVVKNIRNEIIKLGGEVRFDAQLTDMKVEAGNIKSIEINGSEWIDVEHLILAIGHSARDTYEMVYKRGMHVEQSHLP